MYVLSGVVPEPVKVPSGPPHFDGKNYYMWQRQMSAFIRGKGQIIWDVTENKTHVHLINFLSPRSREMHDTNNKVVNYLF
jgi:aminopeptidase-like protein